MSRKHGLFRPHLGRGFPQVATTTSREGVGGLPNIGMTPWPLYLETYNFNGEFYEESGAGQSYSVMRSNNRSLVHFKAVPGEHAAGDASGDRSELTNFNTQRANGTECWGAWSVMVEPISAEYPSWDNTSVMHLGQVHNEDSGSPPIAFVLTADSSLAVLTRSGTSVSEVTTTRYTDSNFRRGSVYHVVMNFKTGPTGDGFIKVWINGTLVYDSTVLNPAGIAIGYTDKSFTYWKFGVYRSGAGSTGNIGAYYWNMDFDTSDKSARITNPGVLDPGSVYEDCWKIESLGAGFYNVTADGTTFTFTDVPLGTAQFDRYISIAANYSCAVAQDVTGVTIQPKTAGGVNIGSPIAMTIHTKAPGATSTSREFIASASVPDGVTGDIVVTTDGTCTHCQIWPVRLQGIMSNTPLDTATDTTLTGNTLTPSPAHDGHGLVLVGARGNSAGTWTFNNLTKIGQNTPEGTVVGTAGIGKLVDDTITSHDVTGSSTPTGSRASLALWR